MEKPGSLFSFILKTKCTHHAPKNLAFVCVRTIAKKGVVLTLGKVEGLVNAEAVYCSAQLGYDTLDTTATLVYSNLPNRPANVHSTLVFDSCDWTLAEAAKWRVAHAKALKYKRPFTLGPAPDQLLVTIKDADSDAVVGEFSSTLHEVMQASTGKFQVTLPGSSSFATVSLSTDLVDYRAEMIPLLGHIHLGLLQFKSYAATPVFKSSLRFVCKYGDKEVASSTYVNNPHPKLKNEEAHFAVYDVFTPVSVEVYEDKVAVKGPRPSRLLSLLRGSKAEVCFVFPGALVSSSNSCYYFFGGCTERVHPGRPSKFFFLLFSKTFLYKL